MHADQENSVWTAHPHLLAEKNTYVEFFSVCLFLLFLKRGFDFFFPFRGPNEDGSKGFEFRR